VRSEIWDKLDAMQGQRCAYCEAALFDGDRHIEHFRQRSRYPQGTYDWDNLFGSCNRHNTCGKHKDQCGPYQYTDLIKPDREDPQAFLVFSPDGSVHPRAHLNALDRHRATETIRIFNLNGALRRLRYAELSGYLQTAEYFAALAAHYDESEWWPLLAQELAQSAPLPFATAIKHVLTRRN
jgi:uncharacterized protein (TIGR02646 family)